MKKILALAAIGLAIGGSLVGCSDGASKSSEKITTGEGADGGKSGAVDDRTMASIAVESVTFSDTCETREGGTTKSELGGFMTANFTVSVKDSPETKAEFPKGVTLDGGEWYAESAEGPVAGYMTSAAHGCLDASKLPENNIKPGESSTGTIILEFDPKIAKEPVLAYGSQAGSIHVIK